MKLIHSFRSLGYIVLMAGALSGCPDQKPTAPEVPAKPTASNPTNSTATTLPAANTNPPDPSANVAPSKPKVTLADVDAFLKKAEPKLKELFSLRARTEFAMQTNINDNNEQISAHANEMLMAYLSQITPQAVSFLQNTDLRLPEETKRKLELLVLLQTPVASPFDEQKQKELAAVTTGLTAGYGKILYCLPDGTCLGQKEASARIGSKEYMTKEKQDVLLDTWVGWHNQARKLKEPYTKFVELANQGAHDIHYKDLGDFWRANYDMSPEEFEKEAERLWAQVEPLYKSLHCYVRNKLSNHYGADKVPNSGLIPAHLLGNLWSQEWGQIYPIVAPKGTGSDALDISVLLQAWVDKKLKEEAAPQGAPAGKPTKVAPAKVASKPKGDPKQDLMKKADQIQEERMKMARLVAGLGEGFFDSLGLGKLPETFWERSMLIKPRDRKVQCHASADDLGLNGDVVLKMCIEPTEEVFHTIHHELGHDYYFLAYNHLSPIFQNSAHDGFHEAVGDAITFSITPEYLVKIGLLAKAPESNPELEIRQLLKDALSRVAFLPFGKIIDQWRWGVFSGKIKPENYNQAWWALRAKYQGIAPPVARTEEDFDPGAKYHVPANVPYMRYFLARILQFQFHKALCKAAGYDGPLHKCSIYGSKEAGKKLQEMLAMGSSKPWPEALKAISGETKMDAQALLEFYHPLIEWLDEQNKGQTCGW